MENNQGPWAEEEANLEEEVQKIKNELSEEQPKVDPRDAELDA